MSIDVQGSRGPRGEREGSPTWSRSGQDVGQEARHHEAREPWGTVLRVAMTAWSEMPLL